MLQSARECLLLIITTAQSTYMCDEVTKVVVVVRTIADSVVGSAIYLKYRG